MKNKFRYIVIDTNVLISAAILPKSKTAQVLELAVLHFVIAQNRSTWQELETRIERSKFDAYFGENGRIAFLTKLARLIQDFPSQANVRVSRDVDDNKFIGLAMDAGATILISGDPDLKDVQVYQGIEILSPAQFLERFKS
jgi:putative PIN family toxin of toxin-antitoxin system